MGPGEDGTWTHSESSNIKLINFDEVEEVERILDGKETYTLFQITPCLNHLNMYLKLGWKYKK